MKKFSKILKIQKIDALDKYDLEVADNHNFFANGILVHNCRCIITKDGMFSRNGKEFHSAPHIFNSLKPLFKTNPDLIFDGELYADKFANDFNSIVSLVKKTKPTEEDLELSEASIEYHIYDLPSYKANFGSRYNQLQAMDVHERAFKDTKCKIVDTRLVNDSERLMELYGEYVESGYEGQMLRVNEQYENKRSKFLLKHKSFVDEEYTILDICEGEGNRAGTAGYMVFETAEGKRFKSNVKGTWEETAEMLKNRKQLIGKSATVKYFNLTPDGIPRFPYVIAIGREDYE